MDVADQLEDHRARCLPHLLTLRMVARDMPEAPPPWLAAADVTQATKAILTEVEAAVRAVTGGGPGGRAGPDSLDSPGAGIFLSVRLSRLAVAADGAITAAGAGDFTQLRIQLRRFETLTSAIWAVQEASR